MLKCTYTSLLLLILLLQLLQHILCIDTTRHSDNDNDTTQHNSHILTQYTNTSILPSETAYVGIYYEQNNYHDSIQLTALRTMMKTIEQTGSTRDRLALILPTTKQSIRDILTNDGIKLVEVLSSTWKNKNSQCWYEFRAIDVFALTLYKRVIYLDNDHLVINNMDRLFLCGEYCMQYSSLIHFTDTVFLIKPDTDKFKYLVDKFNSLQYNVNQPKFCIDEAAVFWLHVFGDIEASPLFPVQPTRQYTDGMMRMQASVSLNAMLWYEKFSWALMRHDEWVDLTDPFEPPGLSIGFHSLKPYYWPAGIFFNLNWLWTEKRTELLHESYTIYIVTAITVLILFYIFASKGLKALFYVYYTKWRGSRVNNLINKVAYFTVHPMLSMHNNNNISIEQSSNILTKFGSIVYVIIKLIGIWCPLLLCLYLLPQGMRDRNHLTVFLSTTIATLFGMISISGYWLNTLGSDVCGWLFGLPMDVCIGFIVYEFIPSLTPPHYAWPTFAMGQIIGKYTAQHILVLSYAYQTMHSSSKNLRKRTVSDTENQLLNNSTTSSTDHIEYGFKDNDSKQQNNNIPTLQWSLSNLYIHIIWSFTAWGLCRLTVFPEFAVKISVLFPVLIVVFLTSINSYRYSLALIENDTKQRKHIPI